MRRRMVAVALAVPWILAAGCQSPCATVGWRFEVGKPSVFNTPGLVQQTNGPLAVSPLGSTLPPVITGAAIASAAPEIRGSTAPHVLGRMRPAEECTLEDICLMLRRIESRLQQQAPMPRPLPSGPPAPQTE